MVNFCSRGLAGIKLQLRTASVQVPSIVQEKPSDFSIHEHGIDLQQLRSHLETACM